jgi:hypothetical protein
MTPERSPRERWIRAHGYDDTHGPGRQNRMGKLIYATFWAAGRQALIVNNGRTEADMVEPYRCRWGDHWAHGETAAEHWHIGHRPRADERW